MNKNSFKIILISINSAWKHGNLGVDQLAGYLRGKGFSLDMGYYHKKDSVKEIFEKIKGKYAFYGFSVTSANYNNCKELATYLKEYDGSSIIDFGGGFVTRYYREVFLEVKELDFAVLGDGEEPTEYLLEQLIDNTEYIKRRSTGHISIVSRTDQIGKIQHINQDITYFPVFDYYEQDTPERNSRKVFCVQTKNNVCTGNCSFCTERHGKVVYKDISLIIEQIKIAYTRYGIRKVFFTDDNIFDPNDEKGKENVRKICLELKKLDFKLAYQCYCKAISLKDTPQDRELLSLMKEVGFVEVFVGIESADPDDLILYNKFTTVKDNRTIIRLLTEYGLTPIMGFIGFNPYSTFKKIENNFNFLCDVMCTYLPNYLFTFVNINKYTAFYDMIAADGLMLSDDSEYINIRYDYADKSVAPILRYIEDDMLPKLNLIQYELDWVMYSYEECKVWCTDIKDYDEIFSKFKQEDFEVIKNYLGILFIEHDLEKFKFIEQQFWKHFLDRQAPLKEIYDYLIELHIKDNLNRK